MVSSDHAPEVGDGAPNAPGDDSGRQVRPKRRSLRFTLWMIAASVGAALLATVSLLWLLHNLDHPRVKPRLQALVREHAGLSIDYEALSILPWEGVRARWLRVAQPDAFQSFAQDFLRVEGLSVRMDARPLIEGGPLVIERVDVHAIAATVVREESGATTLSVLFPSDPSAPEPRTQYARTLSELPDLAIRGLAIGGARARLLEVARGVVTRESELGTLALSGAVQMAPSSLRGTALHLTAVPALRVDVREGAQSRHAELSLSLEARAEQARSLQLRLRSDLRAQSWSPTWTGSSQLVQLDARAAFDERAGRTTITCSRLSLLGGMLAVNAGVDVFDVEPLRIDASGKADVAVTHLPLPIDGVALEALALSLEARSLSWQGDRLAGAVEWTGGLRALGLTQAEQSAQLGETRLTGVGSFDDPSGHFQTEVKVAALALRSPAITGRVGDLALSVQGKTRVEAAGVQQVEALASLSIPTAQATTLAGQRLEVGALRLSANLAGVVAALREGRLATLASSLQIAQVEAQDGAQRVRLDRVTVQASGNELVRDDASPSGFQGATQLSLSLPALRVLDGGPGRPAALTAEALTLAVRGPLSLTETTGKLSLGKLSAGDAGLQGLQLDFGLQQPTRWSADTRGPASLRATGRAAALRAGDSRMVLDALDLSAQRLDASRYHGTLDGVLSSVVLGGAPMPERLTARLAGDVHREPMRVDVSGTLRGARGAEVTLKLDGDFARATQRLRYHAQLAAEKLDAFAGLIHGAVPSAKSVKVEGTRLRATARGDLAGVLRAAPSAWPEPMADPLATARGTQSMDIALDGLDHQAADSALVVPSLTLSFDSEHRDKGAGGARLRLRAPSLRYAGGGDSLHLTDLDEQLTASFDSAPSRGRVDVRSTLTLGTAAQSWFPAYRVADMRLQTHVQVDRLRSIFLRELAMENAAAGTSMQASGAIELRTVSTPGGDKTILGREALALEGSLEQALEPFEKLGFASRASGKIRVPFRIESGGLLGYRLLAALEARQVSLATKDRLLDVDELDGVIPIVEEFAFLPGGVVVSAGPRASPLTEARFFDVHPFLSGNDYVTARSITLNGFSPLGPFAANVRVDRSNFLIDQLQVGFRGGEIVGQARIAYRDGDPLVRLRLNATGVRSGQSQDVLDANAALSFQPKVMTLDGKVQLVRVSRTHLLGILDVIDPFHESASANRVRQGLTLGYPKFVRFRLHDGAVDTKVDLGGIAKIVRIDEIKAVPLGPILQRYVMPTLAGYASPKAVQTPTPVAAEALKETP